MGVLDSGRHELSVGLVVVLASFFAGCTPGLMSPSHLPAPQLRPAADWLDPTACKSDHGVSVVPCHVDLTENQPNAKVTTKGPKGGTFTLDDTECTSKGIAEIEGGNDHYVVTAGSVPGLCTATFTDKTHSGKIIGIAKLKIAFYKREHCPPTC